MYLMYYVDEKTGERVYTIQKTDPSNKPCVSAHPEMKMNNNIIDGNTFKALEMAKFTPEDKYSRHRLLIKRRFGLLLTQRPKPVY